MSLSSDTARIQYTLSGSGQTLAVPFKFIAAADLSVISTASTGVDTTLVLNTNYTVAGGGSIPTTGTITMVAGASGDIITIYRNASILQPSVYANNDAFPAKTTETSLDRAVMQIQQLDLAVDRSIRLPVSNASISPLPLPTWKNKLLGFDANGLPTPSDPLGAASLTGSVLEVSSYAAARLLPITGLVTGRQVQISGYSSGADGGEGLFSVTTVNPGADNNGTILKLDGGSVWLLRCYSGPIKPQWFGAKFDDATDDTTAVQAAITACPSFGRVDISGGTAIIGSQLTISTDYVTISGSGKLKAKAATDFSRVMYATGRTGVVIRDIEIDVNGTNRSGVQTVTFNALALENVTDCSVINVTARNSSLPRPLHAYHPLDRRA
jgi:hypothetical protein